MLGPAWSCTSSTAPMSCFAISTAAAAAASATVSRSARQPACCTPCCRCSRPGRRMSASRPITSSSRSATISGRATRPAPASTPRCAPSSSRWRRRCGHGRGRLADGRARGRRRAGRGRRIACADDDVRQVCIWTPDKDLAQCVRGDRVVQVDRRSNAVRNAEGVREKFGVEPARIPDFLALVGDAADGYPGIPGIGKVTAARLVNRHGSIEEFPPEVLGERPRSGAAVQGSRHAAFVRRGATRRRRAPLARPDPGLRRLGRASRRRAPARALACNRRPPAAGMIALSRER